MHGIPDPPTPEEEYRKRVKEWLAKHKEKLEERERREKAKRELTHTPVDPLRAVQEPAPPDKHLGIWLCLLLLFIMNLVLAYRFESAIDALKPKAPIDQTPYLRKEPLAVPTAPPVLEPQQEYVPPRVNTEEQNREMQEVIDRARRNEERYHAPKMNERVGD